MSAMARVSLWEQESDACSHQAGNPAHRVRQPPEEEGTNEEAEHTQHSTQRLK